MKRVTFEQRFAAENNLPSMWMLLFIVTAHLSPLHAAPKAAGKTPQAALKDKAPVSKAIPKPAAKAPPSPNPAAPALENAPTGPFSKLTPFDNGPGIVICEPTGANLDEAVTNFGTGCTRWLHFVVSGQGELGRTPTLMGLRTPTAEKRHLNLRFEPDGLNDLARLSGATHAVTSVLSGTAEKLSLELSLWKISRTAKAILVNASTLSGSREEMLAALPGAARQISIQLGVAAPRVPEKIEISADEMAAIGSVVFNRYRISPELQAQLVKLAEREPLAAMVALDEEKTRAQLTRLVLQRAPDNLTALAKISLTAGNLMAPYSDQWEPILKRFPHNYQATAVWYAQAYWSHDFTAQRSLGELGVRCAPANPLAWMRLGSSISNQADSVRHGSVIGDMTESQVENVTAAYALWQEAEQCAVRLDPQNGNAWHYLAQAATHSGDSALADSAFWKAQQLWPDDPDVHYWGLEMYQPKWGGDPQKLLKVVEIVIPNNSLLPKLSDKVASALLVSDLKQERARKLLMDYIEREINGYGWLKSHPQLHNALAPPWTAVKEKPDDSKLWMDFSKISATMADRWYMGRPANEFTKGESDVFHRLYGLQGLAALYALELSPNNASALMDYAYAGGALSLFLPMQVPALLEHAIELDPKNPVIYRKALALLRTPGQGTAEAIEAIAKRAATNPTLFDAVAPDIALAFKSIVPPTAGQFLLMQKAQSKLPEIAGREDAAIQRSLGFYYWNTNDLPQALTAFANGARLEPNDVEARYLHALMLGNLNRHSEAFEEYRAVLRLDPDYGMALLNGSEIALAFNRPGVAEDMLDRATFVLPLWPLAHEHLGAVLNKLNRRNEARVQWQRATDLADSPDSDLPAAVAARKALTKFPAE